jgi:hypothetical protein
MKLLAFAAGILGLVCQLFALIFVIFDAPRLGVTGAGYLRGASSLFLLALVIMVFDHLYHKKK